MQLLSGRNPPKSFNQRRTMHGRKLGTVELRYEAAFDEKIFLILVYTCQGSSALQLQICQC